MNRDQTGESTSGADDSPLNKGRRETDAERLDRNWDELLQELRVTQTGVQLLSGFLLTLPFQQRFVEIPQRDKIAYLVAFSLALVSTALLVAPVSAHRLLFRRGAKAALVTHANRYAQAGLFALGLTVVMVAFLIFDVVLGLTAAIAAAAAALVLFAAAWITTPLSQVRRQDPATGQHSAD
jgi:hypothetical protein